ncbi:MAG TPA: FAD-binding oxidoreductase [Steroidobacteraceae bacterium]|nr:FAD-binding oxidoreductase [Steroidobacteraceae bacterium]
MTSPTSRRGFLAASAAVAGTMAASSVISAAPAPRDGPQGMKLILPPHLSERAFTRGLSAFAGVVGREWVLDTDMDRHTYLDAYAPGDAEAHAPSAAVAPGSVGELQALVRLANEHRLPLWPISRGKNLGYGGSAPCMPGTVIVDLGRLNKVLELNEELAYCVLEPGVGFFQLYDEIKARNLDLQMGIPGNAWGSVIGNALERGFSQAGDHSANICGMEVVLPDGSLVRTGMGAMGNNATGPLFRHGFGPSWDQMFVQSNFGIVTQMGLWLKPAPQSVISVGIKLPRPEDVGRWTDIVTPLRLAGVLEGNLSVTSYQASATLRTERSEWYSGRDALPDSVVARIMSRYDVGWWNGTLRLSGYAEVNEANLKIIQKAFNALPQAQLTVSRWHQGEPGSGVPAPSVLPLQIVNWHGGRGGHLGFSPILPAGGSRVIEQLARTRQRYREFGIDYSGTFYHSGRSVSNVNLMIYNRDDADLTARTRALFSALVKDAAAAGYAEYRTHLSYMDEVAATFDHNDHALWRLHGRVKDALDPNGILAPGKSGIWPQGYRDRRQA